MGVHAAALPPECGIFSKLEPVKLITLLFTELIL